MKEYPQALLLEEAKYNSANDAEVLKRNGKLFYLYIFTQPVTAFPDGKSSHYSKNLGNVFPAWLSLSTN